MKQARRGRAWLVVALVASAVLWAAAPSMAASQLYWGTAQSMNPPEQGDSGITLSCQSKYFCVASGYGDFYRKAPWVMTGTDLTSASPTWTASGYADSGNGSSDTVESQAAYCNSPSFCLTVGNADYSFSSDATASSPTWSTNAAYPSGYTGVSLTAVTCVSTSLCVATDAEGNILTSTDPSGGQPWSVHGVDSGNVFAAITCTSGGLCVAADNAGNVFYDADVATTPASWTKTTVDSGNMLTDVTCVSDSLCFATDNAGNLITSTDPTGAAADWTSATLDSGTAIEQISCASSALCVFVDQQGNAFDSFTPSLSTAGSWTKQTLESGTELGTVTCSSDNTCVAADGGGDYFVGTATVLGAPTVDTTPPAGPTADTTATLSGTVNPNDDEVTGCQFTWGTSATTLTNTAACTPSGIGDGTTPVAVSASIGGLTPGTSYYYALSATNSHGTNTSGATPFVTGGGTVPSIDSTSAGGGYGTSTGSLVAMINPHNAVTSYQFFWGSQSESVSSASQIANVYPNATPAQQIPVGTSDVTVSAPISGLQNDRTYYFRVVASNGFGTVFSAEASLSTYAPAAINTAPPYLQDSGGYDADAGYLLRCRPGSWSGSNGDYVIHWVYLSGSTVLGPAFGTTATSILPGDEYNVSSVDVGRELGCEVQAYSLDGLLLAPNPALVSESIVPEGPTQGIVPQWLKNVLEADSVAGEVQGVLSTAAECLEFADIPGLGLGICSGSIIVFVSEQVIGDYLQNQVDPPDPAFRAIALPPRLKTPPLSLTCPRRLRAPACRGLRIRARALLRADVRVADAMRLLYTTSNRFLIARERHRSSVQFTQQAAVKVDAGFAAAAFQALSRAARAYATALRQDHVSFARRHPSAAKVAALLNTPAMRAVLRSGISRADAAKTLERLLRAQSRVRPFNPDDLTQVDSSARFAREYDTLTFSDLEAIVSGLAATGQISGATATAMYGQLDAARAACTTAARDSALESLLAAAHGKASAGNRSFLSEAVAPLLAPSSAAPARVCAG